MVISRIFKNDMMWLKLNVLPITCTSGRKVGSKRSSAAVVTMDLVGGLPSELM